MENLKELIKREDHENILLLPSPEYNRYKAIAAINLDRYDEALLYAAKNSYEQAYVYYKLKNFKKSLKILRKLSGKKVDILKSQNLYFLGYYDEAYKLLSAHGNKNEFAVNLAAMDALNALSHQERPSMFSSMNSNKIQAIDYKFTDSECRMEYEYNDSFRYVEDEKEYVRTLLELQDKYKVRNSCIEKQIKNLMGDEIDDLTKKESEIVAFNKGLTAEIATPVLFQKHFTDKSVSDYKVFKEYQSDKFGFISGTRSFEPSNQRLRCLKALVISKRKQTPERMSKVLKTLENNDQSIESEILRLLSTDLPENVFQERAMELILKANP